MDRIQDKNIKVINMTGVRRVCRNQGLQVSNEALDLINEKTEAYILGTAEVAKECGNKIILKRHLI